LKNTFLEYNPLSKIAIQELWEKAIFIFDSNVLLNLYRYSDETLTKFLETISLLKDRVWLPYHVGFEFHKNRLGVIGDQKKRYEDFDKRINDIIGEIENKNRNPFLSEVLFEKLLSTRTDIKNEIDDKIKAYEFFLESDLVLDKINSIFSGKIGNPFSSIELRKLFDEGAKRYNEKVPPGYCDFKKPENDRYGDLIIWKQIILKSKTDKVDVIFIIDDRKEDWWLEYQGKTISPRPELLKEFRLETERRCHFYKPFQFLEYSNEYLGGTILEGIISEVKNYEPVKLNNESFIKIRLVLKGKIADLNLLINEMKVAGYNLYTESDEIHNLHDIYIVLPNIPDLERRLNAKYLSNLIDYNVILVSFTKD
jgi:hypothetical protein